MMEVDDDTEIEEKKQEENMVENDTNMKNNKPQFLSQALTRQIVNKDDVVSTKYVLVVVVIVGQ